MVTALQWISAPLSGAADHVIAPWAYWHGRLMVLAWSILIPVGLIAARFFKVLPGQDWPRQLDNRIWWHLHLWCQSAGVAVMSIGIGMAWLNDVGGSSAAYLHGALGWAVFTIGLVQVVGGLLRGSKGGPREPVLRGDHFDMTARRQLFERVHKFLGWLAVVPALGGTASGLLIADAPRWMAISLALWWCALCVVFVVLQRRGRTVDTYQAIWGPSPEYPGNQIEPIGWGVQRLPDIRAAGIHRSAGVSELRT